ncbi:MAG: DUF4115 domain-containing protein [Anaerolineales bacterium]|nr:DUF4115 domain-containing protein [Anaerolineales bacterium]
MPETIGQILKKAREARVLTLNKASELTCIRPIFLEALEEDDYSAMASVAQGRGFLRMYAEFLELDIDQVLEELRRNNESVEPEIIGPIESDREVNLEPMIELKDEPENEETAVEEKTPFWKSLLPRISWPEKTSGEVAIEETVQPSQTEELLEPETPEPETAAGMLGETTGELILRSRWEQLSDHANALLRGQANYWSKRLEPVSSLFDRSPVDPEPELEVKAAKYGPALPEFPFTRLEHSPTRTSQLIFKQIGIDLRLQREMLSLTINEVERHIHIRTQLLQALEDGNFEGLPSTVQTQGILANYANFLGMDSDALLLHFADGLQKRRLERYPEQNRQTKREMPLKQNRFSLRSLATTDLIFGAGIIILLTAFAIWQAIEISSIQRAQNIEPTVPSISDVLLATAGPGEVIDATATQAQQAVFGDEIENPAEAPEDIPDEAANVIINLVAVERAWVRVTVDGEIKFEGRVQPDTAYAFEAQEQVTVLTGNAAAIRITYNQRELGLLGSYGEIAEAVFTINGILTPTPQPTATATATAPVTVTPTNTQRSTPTAEE